MQRFTKGVVLVVLVGCGARSALSIGEPPPDPPCEDGETEPCGSDVGECKKGKRTCHDEAFGACEGARGPVEEECNGKDDDCDGRIDEPFHVGEPCDDPDTDVCQDSVITCDGCSKSPDKVETCNGIDDNCNGIIDADCEVGNCKPTLLVTGSSASSANCVDFPVHAGSKGRIVFPCGGGDVFAKIGDVEFTGKVVNGNVDLDGVYVVTAPDTPDNCTWQTNHHIDGNLADGKLTYTYDEFSVSGVLCWQPCTEWGTVKIGWEEPDLPQ